MIGPYKFEILLGGLCMRFYNNPYILSESEEGADNLTAWLESDVKTYGLVVLKEIDDVLSGKGEKIDMWGGNAFNAFIHKDMTEIHFCYEEDDPSIKPCSLPTTMLREVVELWLKELEKFNADKDNYVPPQSDT